MGYQGKVFPVNPREDSILGFRCYKNMLDILEPVDVCVLLVSADLTMQVADELVQRKRRYDDVTAAVCMSAGFGELNTSEGNQREQELVRTLRSASIRGNPCLGAGPHSRMIPRERKMEIGKWKMRNPSRVWGSTSCQACIIISSVNETDEYSRLQMTGNEMQPYKHRVRDDRIQV
jgi:hypothetical protein